MVPTPDTVRDENPSAAWKPEMSVGVPALDEQHQALLTLLRQLQQAMAEGRAREKLDGVMTGIIRYAEMHFRFEEDLLEKAGYPDLTAHRREHARLFMDARKFHLDYRTGRLRFGTPVLAFLRNWVVGHILGSDRAYSEHLTRGNTV